MPDFLRIVSLNIRHGGGARTTQLMGWIKARQPSATVVTEWRDNFSGQQMRESLAADGLDVTATLRSEKANSVLLAARGVIVNETMTPLHAPAGDLVLARLDGLAILGCYFPQRMAKSPFFEQCVEVASRTSH